MFEPNNNNEKKAKIKVIGVGGGGGNAINDMIESNVEGVEFVAINTDVQDLEKSKANHKIHLGDNGLGAGANPEIAKLAIEDKKNEIKKLIENEDMIFITAGMGGGTGTGAAPVVASIAKDLGILTIGIVTKPFRFEGPLRESNADYGVQELKKYVDTLIVIPNETLHSISEERITLLNAFKIVNNVLRSGVKGIAELITKKGYVNLDFADVKTMMKGSGVAVLGFGEALEGEPAIKAAEMAVTNPLLEKSIEGANKILLNITGGIDFELHQLTEITTYIKDTINNKTKDPDIMFGLILDENMKGVKVSIVATDFEKNDNIPKPQNNLGVGTLFGDDNTEDDSDDDKEFLVPTF